MPLTMSEKIYSKDLDKIRNELEELKFKTANKIYKAKHDLLSVYLMNYVLYCESKEENKKDSPIFEKLVKTTILLEKVVEMEDKAEEIIKEYLKKENLAKYQTVKGGEKDESERRPVTAEILKNKVSSGKVQKNNPRKKFKTKADNLKEKAKIEPKKDIDN